MKRPGIILILFIFSMQVYSQNYDESRVAVYALPEVLKTSGNTFVTNKILWEKVRRPEVLSLFENNIYGQMPRTYDSLTSIITNKQAGAMGGKAHLKEVQINVFKNNKSVKINLVLFSPANLKGRAPVFLLINNRDKNNTDPARITKSDFWPAEMIIDNGYAIAAFHVSDVAPDNKDSFQNGVLQLYPEQKMADNGMKAIGAWAWGASRVMDYLVKDYDIDAEKIAIVGHSRGGKAALWAAAEDQRFSICFSNCSGNTGAALSRRKFGETIKIINDHFPWWFCNNYKKYNDNEEALPVDQHMLISLIAPRPVYVTSATKDLWADPKGSYLSLINATKVYDLYGIHVRLTPEPPPVNSPVIESKLGYHNREGVHNLTAYDWAQFIKFADYHYKKNRK